MEIFGDNRWWWAGVPFALCWAGFLAWGIGGYLLRSPSFSVKTLEISGESRLSEAELLEHLAERQLLGEETSLALLSAVNVDQALEELPVVSEAEVFKVWPNQLKIIVKEHRPEGIFVAEGGSYVFNGEGLLFSQALPWDFRNLEGPVLTADGLENLDVGAQLPHDAFALQRHYGQVLRQAAPLVHQEVSEIHFAAQEGVILVFEDGARYRCGHRLPEEVGPVVEELRRRSRQLRPIMQADLIAPSHVAVRWGEPRGALSNSVAQHHEGRMP